MDKVNNIYDFGEFIKQIENLKVERQGFILLPSFEGYNIYAIDAERLELYIQCENMYRKSNPEIKK